MISGLQKMTLLDFPGKVACTVFLQGCNYRCPFCHNSELLGGCGEEFMSEEEFFAFLEKRKGLLDGVAVSGGEPTLYKGLETMLARIKEMGFAVKLDTNGCYPERLAGILEAGLADYVAMDIKNSAERYAKTAGMQESMLRMVEQSIQYLLSGVVDYEFRTTVVAELHDALSIQNMGAWVQNLGEGKRAKRWYLQRFADRESVLLSGLHAPQSAQMQQYAEKLAPYAECVSLRGVE